ncbi:hypothetical protein BJ165DRAFT_757131 [Panaeolus papilionaceus]|nr:hypothetical protein BJ165DRAFT_757131 [Panaeolus papilionaceus]
MGTSPVKFTCTPLTCRSPSSFCDRAWTSFNSLLSAWASYHQCVSITPNVVPSEFITIPHVQLGHLRLAIFYYAHLPTPTISTMSPSAIFPTKTWFHHIAQVSSPSPITSVDAIPRPGQPDSSTLCFQLLCSKSLRCSRVRSMLRVRETSGR